MMTSKKTQAYKNRLVITKDFLKPTGREIVLQSGKALDPPLRHLGQSAGIISS